MNQRAITYRKLNNIPAEWGTAVNVQSMVFGNMGDDCATGVAFTRDPSTGENYFYGEYLVNAQGEDVVAGIRTPQPINKANGSDKCLPSMEEVMPACYRPAGEYPRHSGKALQGHAGHRVHHREGQALHAPDQERQAHRHRRHQDRRRHGQGRS